MKKVLTWTLIAITAFVLLFAAAYWGYLDGIRSSTTLEAAYLPIIAAHSECYENRDWECVRISNEFLATMASSRMNALRDASLIDESISEHVDDFLSWYDSYYQTK